MNSYYTGRHGRDAATAWWEAGHSWSTGAATEPTPSQSSQVGSPAWDGSWSATASEWTAQETWKGGPQSWYKQAPWRSGTASDGAAAKRATSEPAVPRRRPQAPDAATVRQALDRLEDAKKAAVPQPPDRPDLGRVLQLCAAAGDAIRALDNIRDGNEAAFLNTLKAMDVTNGEAEHGTQLDDLKRKDLNAFAPLQAWLCTALLEEEFHTVICIASALHQQGYLDPPAEASVRSTVLEPLLKALREPADASSPQADMLRKVPGFGAFTTHALEALGLAAGPSAERWQQAAREELRRKEMLRLWWKEDDCPGLTTWLAYDLNGGEGSEAWELGSDGEAFGLAQGPDDEIGDALLPPLAKDESRGHAERIALLALTARILGKFPKECTEGVRVEGVVMIFSLRPPSVASVYAMRQFLRLFPWVHFSVGYGPSAKPPSVQTIGAPPSWGEWSKWQDGTAAGSNGASWAARGSYTSAGRSPCGSWSNTASYEAVPGGVGVSPASGNGQASWNGWL